MAEAFTWFAKLTDVLEQVPDEGMRQRLAYAIVMYGSTGAEPGLEWPLSALFEAVREDLDNSRAARERGRKGGRPRKAKRNEDADGAGEGAPEREGADDSGFDDAETPAEVPAVARETCSESGSQGLETPAQVGFELAETTGFETSKTTLQTGFPNQKTTLQTGFPNCETQTKPNQTKPSQAKGEGRAGAATPPPKKSKRFVPPTVAEVEAYGRESGYVVNPIAFTSWHESRGWKVGNQPMKDWRAAVRSWWTKDHPDSAPPRPQGAASKRRTAAEELAEVEAQIAARGGGA